MKPITIELKAIIERGAGGGCDLDHSANRLRTKAGLVFGGILASLAK